MMDGSENYSSLDNITKSAGSSAPTNSRWNPTKEQISMLESLYRQGIRTPNADQIQQITSRLRAFGHIEGKNVFYWFQNHKARQRQKQKQESLAYFHRFLHNKATSLHHHHHPPPVLMPPPCPNVCSPHYLPQGELGFCPQYPKVMLPMGGGFKRTSRSEKTDSPKAYPRPGYEFAVPQEDNTINPKSTNRETLPLFPLHPTGILQGREKPLHSLVSSSTAATDEEAITPCDDQTAASNCGQGYAGKPFFNFLSGDQYPCKRDKN